MLQRRPDMHASLRQGLLSPLLVSLLVLGCSDGVEPGRGGTPSTQGGASGGGQGGAGQSDAGHTNGGQGNAGGTVGDSGPDGTQVSGSHDNPYQAQGLVPAFPGAEGHGARALEPCRSLPIRILEVTNVDDSGPGSLRDALGRVSGDRFDFVVFRTSGTIVLDSRLRTTSARCLYVAGQTAPKGGVTVRKHGLGFKWANDVAIRFIKSRPGVMAPGTPGTYGNIGLSLGSPRNTIADHLSLSWANDKALTVTNGVNEPIAEIKQDSADVSVQRTILSETANHPTAAQLTGGYKTQINGVWTVIDPPTNHYNVSLHANLFHSNSHRNPQMTTDGTRIVNNVVYNWRQGALQSSYTTKFDAVSNYFKPGPSTGTYNWEITWSCSPKPSASVSIFASGNIGPHDATGTGDPWTGTSRMIACYYKTGATVGEPLPQSFRRTSALPPAWIPVTVRSAADAYTSVLGDVGANARVDCHGSWISEMDSHDQRALEETAKGNGLSGLPTQANTPTPPLVPSATGCADSDGDGMPDAFELRYWGAAESGKAELDDDQDGYLNVEEYLNGTMPRMSQ